MVTIFSKSMQNRDYFIQNISNLGVLSPYLSCACACTAKTSLHVLILFRIRILRLLLVLSGLPGRVRGVLSINVLYFPYLTCAAGCMPLLRRDVTVARPFPSLHPHSYSLQTSFLYENRSPWHAWPPSVSRSESPQRCCLHLHQKEVPADTHCPDPARASGKLLRVQRWRPACAHAP